MHYDAYFPLDLSIFYVSTSDLRCHFFGQVVVLVLVLVVFDSCFFDEMMMMMMMDWKTMMNSTSC